MKRMRVLDISMSALIVLLIAFTLAPAVARLQRSPGDAKCQSNLHQWAKAMDLYLVEYHQLYPTNRTTPLTGHVDAMVPIPDNVVVGNQPPKRFVFGPNWVEALYPYIQASAGKTGQVWKSFRKCPNAQNLSDRTGGYAAQAYACMTYAFNGNLPESSSSLQRNPASLMMLRETDRRVNSILRPANNSTGNSTAPPIAPFLTASDPAMTSPGIIVPNQHATGSYILFADGHIRYFTTDYYTDTPTWDPVTGQWYNFVYANPANDTERMHNKTIAITP